MFEILDMEHHKVILGRTGGGTSRGERMKLMFSGIQHEVTIGCPTDGMSEPKPESINDSIRESRD